MKILMMMIVALTAVTVCAASDTIALYPFCDDAIGASAIGTVTNAASAGSLDGTVEAKGSAPQVVFSSDVPGRYLYSSGLANADLLVAGLQSIDLGQGEASVSSAFMSVPAAPAALSACHETGYTIEFFFRLPPEAAVPNFSATLQYDCGYEYDGVAYPMKIYLPCGNGVTFRYGLNGYNSESGSKGGFDGKVELGASISAQFKNFALNDGAWHHFAVVETVSGSAVSVKFYVDRILTKTHALPSGVTCAKLTKADPEFKFIRGALSGNVAGLRLSSRSLEPTEFLVASGRAPGSFGSDVLGFYPFDDRPDGAAAAGRTVFNAALPMLSPCTVKTNSEKSVATFSSEGPAKYIFVGEQYGATPYYANPGSVYLSSSQSGDSGMLDFDRLATELSKCHENGHTVEWFFKLTDNQISAMGASYYCKAGYLYGTDDKPNCLCLPFSMAYDEGRQFRFSLDYYSGGRCLTKTLAYQPTDGLWHHVAIVERGTKLEVYVDYVLYGDVTVDGTTVLTSDRSLELVRNALHGKFSCVKVTKRSLSADEFLRASNLETYWPRTLTHVTFDGTAGENLPSSVENDAVSFATANGTVFAAQECTGDFVVNGGVTGNPVYTDRHLYRQSRVLGEGDERENLGSAYAAATGTGESGFRPAPHFRMAAPSLHALPSDFTLEGFFRFDKASWAKDVGTYAAGRDRLCLMARKLSSGYVWKVSVSGVLSDSSHKLSLCAYGEDGTFKDAMSSPVFCDDTWHHIAVTHESASNRLIVYCDYKSVITLDLGQTLKASSGGFLGVGNGTAVSDNDFHGYIDEVRYSTVCLPPESFLKQDRIRTGLLLLVR